MNSLCDKFLEKFTGYDDIVYQSQTPLEKQDEILALNSLVSPVSD